MKKIVLLLLTAAALLQAAQVTVAVNDLDGQNIDSAAIAILSNRVRSELINTNAYTVVERGEMAAILQEQGFQQSGACSESSCLVEIGQLLGVQYMVSGTVGKLNENFYTISLRMIDVGTAKITHAASYDHAGTLERLLSEGLATAVGKLVRSSGTDKNSSGYTGLTGDLFISSSIAGASITIDGNETGLTTPSMFESYPAGPHEIILKKDNFVGSATILVPSQDLIKTEIIMKEIRSTLMLKSAPVGADVVLGKQPLGKTPLKIDTLPTGSYEFKLTMKNCKPVTHTVTLENGKSENVTVTMQPSASISVTTLPDSAKVFLNGTSVGITPWKCDTLSVGDNKITVSMTNYRDTVDLIPTKQGDVIKRDYTLSFSDEFIKSEKKKKQWSRRVIFGLLASAGTVFGVISNKELETARKSYDAQEGYDEKSHNDNWKAVTDAKLKRTIGYSTAGAFGLAFALSIPF